MSSSIAARNRFLACLFVCPAWALAQPDAGQVLREQQPPRRALPDRLPQPEADGAQRPALQPVAGLRVKVREFRFTGEQGLATQDELQKLVADAAGRELSFGELQQVAERATEHLRRKGFLLARAYLPKQDVTEGLVEIALLPGKLQGGVKVQGKNLRIPQSRLEATAQGAAKPGAAVRMEDLERGLLLINDLPGLSARSSLAPGGEPGTTQLVVEATEGPLLQGNASIDNQGNRYTGRLRANAGAQLNDPLRIGDQATVGITAAERLSQLQLGYSAPIGAKGLRASMAYSRLDYRIGEELSNLDSKGSADTVNADLTYPFVRSRNLNLWGRAGYAWKALKDESLGTNMHDKRVSVWTLGASGDSYDALGGGGLNSFSLTFNGGTLDLSSNATDLAADQATARSDGHFNKLGYSLARLQRLSDRVALFGSLAGQATTQNLDSSEKFILGGPSGVRAYPNGEASGDRGLLANVELRYDLPSRTAGNWQLIGFVDAGQVTLHSRLWPGAVATATGKNSYGLQGAGVGANFSKGGSYALRMSYARAIGSNPGLGLTGTNADGSTQRGQFWLQALVWF